MALSGNEPQPEREPLAPRQEYAGAPSTPPRNSTALLHPVPRGLQRAAQSQRDLRSSAHSHTRKGGPSTHRIAAEVVHAHGHARTRARTHIGQLSERGSCPRRRALRRSPGVWFLKVMVSSPVVTRARRMLRGPAAFYVCGG